MLIWKILEIPQTENLTLPPRQACDSLGKDTFGLVSIEIRVILYLSLHGRVEALELKGGADLLLTHEREAEIGGDPPYPRREAGILPEGRQSFPDSDESFLDQVIGILMAGDHTADYPICLFRELLNNHTEGLLVEAFIPKSEYFLVRQGRAYLRAKALFAASAMWAASSP